MTVGLIVLNTLIYFVFGTHLFLHSPASFVDALAFKPREVTSIHDFMEHVPEQFRLLTYMFIHGSVWHLLGNMVFLFVFGDNVEDALGHAALYRFLSALRRDRSCRAQRRHAIPGCASDWGKWRYCGRHRSLCDTSPDVRIWVLFPVPVVSFLPLRFSAAFVIGLWIMYQIASGLFLTGEATAWWAHVGGFFAGALLVIIMRRPGVPLFDTATGIR